MRRDEKHPALSAELSTQARDMRNNVFFVWRSASPRENHLRMDVCTDTHRRVHGPIRRHACGPVCAVPFIHRRVELHGRVV